jgi:hypothetical protein
MIDIRTCTIIDGKFSPKAMALVIEWTLQHQEELLANREIVKANSGTMRKIIPLK